MADACELGGDALVAEEKAGPSPPPVRGGVSEKPSIAVLPFANMSNDPEQEYFADGISEDIITEKDRKRVSTLWFFGTRIG